MKVLIENQVNKILWDNLFNVSPFNSPFQSHLFYEKIRSISGFNAKVIAIEDQGKYLALAVLVIIWEDGIKKLFTRRGIIYGGPLLLKSKENRNELCYLLHSISKYFKNEAIYFEIRNSFDFSKSKYLFESLGWKYEPHFNLRISLKDRSIEDLLAIMKYNRRREIKLSFKHNVIIEECKDLNQIDALYSLLKDLYNTRVQLPLPSIDYFKTLFLSKIGKVFLVIHNKEIIGGSFCLFSQNSINTLYYVGLRNYNKKIFPTHLAVMAALEYGVSNKIEYLDMMGAGKPNQKYGVRDYKQQFGGDLLEYGRFKKINNPLLFGLGRLGLSLYKKFFNPF